MQRFKFTLLTLTLILFAFSFTVNAQFSFKPKRTNLIVNYTPEIGWKLTNTLNTKTYATLNNKNIHLEIVNNRLRIYTMSSGLWNTHPVAKYLDVIKVPYAEVRIDTNSTWFDPYCSLWVSSEGGHIRIFKYQETVTIPISQGKEVKYTNRHIKNHLFLNQHNQSEITSTNTIFTVSPQGNVFEIDHVNRTWRLILKNRTLTSWSSEPPSKKMVFHIFKKTDFKNVIPIGTKNNKYYYQIIDHNNRMGIATISSDYFRVEIEIPPLFDFISPSANTNYYLIYAKEKLGVLYFLPIIKEDEIPMFKTVFYSNTKKLYSDVRKGKSRLLESNNKPIKIPLTSNSLEYVNLGTTVNFGLEIIKKDLLLYTEYNDNQNIKHSGLYNTTQNSWFIKPENSLLTNYPTSILTFEESHYNTPSKYAVSTSTGYLNIQNISDLNSKEFFMITSLVLEYPIDSLVAIPEYDSFTYKFLSQKKWGLMHLENENIQTLLPPKYEWIEHFGFQKSLLLANNYQLGWYGINYCEDPNSAKLIETQAAKVELFSGNSEIPKPNCNALNTTYYSAEYFGDFIVFNSETHATDSPLKTACIQEGLNTTPIIKGHHISIINPYINVTNNKKMTLYNRKLKPIKIDTYDSILIKEKHIIMYNKSEKVKLITSNGSSLVRPKLVTAFYQNKPIKTLRKYSSKYFTGNYFMVETEGQWLVLNPDGKLATKTFFHSFNEALTFERTLLK